MSLLFTGCSSVKQANPDDALTQSLRQYTEVLNQHLPSSEKGITLVRASVSGHQILLSMYQSDNHISARPFLKSYADSLCQQQDVRMRLAQGASYQLSLRAKDKENVISTLTECD